jgi:hypothetical protein
MTTPPIVSPEEWEAAREELPSSAACRHASVIGSGLVLVEDL